MNRLGDSHQGRGVAEYWLVDALGDKIVFQILVRQPDGHAAAPIEDGWSHSPIFGRRFRLRRSQDEWGFWEYRLEIAE